VLTNHELWPLTFDLDLYTFRVKRNRNAKYLSKEIMFKNYWPNKPVKNSRNSYSHDDEIMHSGVLWSLPIREITGFLASVPFHAPHRQIRWSAFGVRNQYNWRAVGRYRPMTSVVVLTQCPVWQTVWQIDRHLDTRCSGKVSWDGLSICIHRWPDICPPPHTNTGPNHKPPNVITSICSGLVVQVVSALLRGSWQDFNWQDALRGPSAIAELVNLYLLQLITMFYSTGDAIKFYWLTYPRHPVS